MRTPKEPTWGEALVFGVVVGPIMAFWTLVALGAF
jgi:hypothetical protein